MKIFSQIGILLVFFFISCDLRGQVIDTLGVSTTIDSLIKECRVLLIQQRKIEEALKIIEVAEKIAASAFGVRDPYYATCRFHRGIAMYFMGKNQDAELLYLEALNIREKSLGKEHPVYAANLNNLALLYYQMERLSEAESYHLEAIKIRKKILGVEHPDYASSLANLAVVYHITGRFEEAGKLYEEAKNIRGKVLGREHAEYAQSINNLAILYKSLGRYELVEPLLIEGKDIRKKLLGSDHPEYAQSLNNLADFYTENERFLEAEMLFTENLKILETAYGKEHSIYAIGLKGQAGMYERLGNFEKATQIALEAKGIIERVSGTTNATYGQILNQLAKLQVNMGRYESAKILLIEEQNILEQGRGKNNAEYAFTMAALAEVYQRMEQFDKAEVLYVQAKTLLENTIGTDHPNYSYILNTIGAFYGQIGRFAEAETMLLEAKSKRASTWGKNHSEYAETLHNLAHVNWARGDIMAAVPFLMETDKIDQSLLLKATYHLSEHELDAYMQKFIEGADRILSLNQTTFALNLACYDNALFHKSFILNTVAGVHSLIGSDTSAIKFNVLKSHNRRLAEQYTLPIAQRDSFLIDELEERANLLEKELIRSVASFGDARRQVQWLEIRQALQPGEAAVELVHYKFSNPEVTDSTMYAALILRPTDTTPNFIPLFEEKQLTALLEKTGDNAQATTNLYAARSGDLLGQAPTYGKELYKLIWRPLDSLLHGVKTVYFSPSGLLHRVSIAALPVNEKKVLSDKYELHQLGSTRSLVVKTPEPVALNYTAAVFGGVQYNRNTAIASTDSTAPEITDNRLWTLIERPRAAGDEGFDYLSGTAQEAASLTRALQVQRVQTQTHTGTQASEEILKSLGRDTVKSPDILHIATHGFFFPDPEKRKDQRFGEENAFKWNENPLFRSGLALAGANAAWSGQLAPGNIEDGIATAYEISHLNLSNTKLVVLSACESGLGDIKGSEGVYGLQRAFKMAGADYLLVSLWQVPDKETVEFMDLFYKSWLGGKTIHEAFAKAQKKMRKKYKEVYKWGAWVLVE